ncbi:MAG TPA: HIT family protein [Candidatus Binatia bacterium]|nr:HIT family protein [Candidatus Binatia bacterium]
MSLFAIHPQLLADCHRLGQLDLCHVLLHKNASVPWFILVPETAVTDLFDLPQAHRTAALDEAAIISHFIKSYLDYVKINFAAIGNVVPQLHLHVVGRKPDDAWWPAPVWGNAVESRPYSAQRLGEIRESLVRQCSLNSS